MASDYEKRDKDKTNAAKQQAKAAKEQVGLQKDANRQAARHSHEMAQIAQQGVEIQAHVASSEIDKNAAIARAEQHKAAAIAAAERQKAEAEARLRDKQGEAAIASSVGQLTDQGVGRVDTYEKNKEDRENIQVLFDRIGDCIGCVEQKGKSTTHFNELAYELEVNGEERYAHGISFAYRYHNLTAAIATLVDLREEAQRVRHWDANRGREETIARIEDQIKDAKEIQIKMAVKTVNMIKRLREKSRNITLGSLAVMTVSFVMDAYIGSADLAWVLLLALFGGFVGALVGAVGWLGDGKSIHPLGWEDMVEMTEEE